MRRVTFLSGFAVGYVLGARAGRARYDELSSAANGLWTSAPVVSLRSSARSLIEERLPAAITSGNSPDAAPVDPTEFGAEPPYPAGLTEQHPQVANPVTEVQFRA